MESQRLNILTSPSLYSFEPQDSMLKASYYWMLNYLESLLKERFSHIWEQLAKIHSGVQAQEAINTYSLISDVSIKELSMQKFWDITENELAAERESYIERLSHEITTLNEKLILDKLASDNLLIETKKKYKSQLKTFKSNEDSLKHQIQ